MSSSPKYIPHYTVTDYRQWEGDWELWQGIPVAITPRPFASHQRCSLRLAQALLMAVEAAGCPAEVLQEVDWIMSDDTVVRPDIIVICGSLPERYVTHTPAIVVEILSPSTADRDQNEKRHLFEQYGVVHYLIVDPDTNRIERFHRDAEGNLLPTESENRLEFTICNDRHLTLNLDSVF